MSARRPAGPDWLLRFRQATGRSAETWLRFVRQHRDDMTALDAEVANLRKAAHRALDEPLAWPAGLELVVELFRFMELRGHWQSWREMLAQALLISRRAGLPHLEARLLDQSGLLASAVGEHAQALALQEEALRLYRELGDRAGVAWVRSHMSQEHWRLANYTAAEQACRDALALFQELDDQEGLAQAHNNWGAVYQQTRQWQEALAHFQQAAVFFRRTGNLRGQAKVTNNQGNVYRLMERPQQAAACYQQAVALCQQIGDEALAADCRLNLAITRHQQGDSASALRIHRQLKPVFRRLGNRLAQAQLANNEGVFLVALGRPDEALAAYEQAVREHSANGNLTLAVRSQYNLVELLVQLNRLAEAQTWLQQARKTMDMLPESPAWLEERHRELAILTNAGDSGAGD